MRVVWLATAVVAVTAYIVLQSRFPDSQSYYALPLALLALIALTMAARLTALRWLFVIPMAVIVAGMVMVAAYSAMGKIEDAYCPQRMTRSEPCAHPQARWWHDVIVTGSLPIATAVGVFVGSGVAPARKPETALVLSAGAAILVATMSVSQPIVEGAQALLGGLAASLFVTLFSRRAKRNNEFLA